MAYSTILMMKNNSVFKLNIRKVNHASPILTYVSKDGYVSKYKLSDHTPYLEIPALSELQHIQDTQGNRWDYYVKMDCL